MPGIFVCYRREDSAPHAGRLYDRLIAQFGADGVFMDVDAIHPGEDFVEVIEKKVAACDVFIVLIGPQWLSSLDDVGHRRLDNPEDFVRLEIVAAIRRTIRIFPVLVGGAEMPKERDLPADIKTLARRHYVAISHERFHRDVSLLIEAFRVTGEATPRERPGVEPASMSYEVVVEGTTEKREIPFVIGVLADLSARSEEPPRRLRERRFVDITAANFDRVLSSPRPRLMLKVLNTLADDESVLPIDLQFRSLEDFGPEHVASMIEPLRKLLEIRSDIANLRVRYSDQLGDLIHEVVRSPEIVEEICADGEHRDELLEGKLKEAGFVREGSDEERWALMQSLSTLVRLTAVRGVSLPENVESWLIATLTDLDAKLSRQLDEIMHHDQFRALEATWRGLHYLVTHLEPIGAKVRVLNVSKSDLAKDLQRLDFDQSHFFKKVYDEEYGTTGGEPFAVLIGDYYFGRNPEDVEVLSQIANVTSAAHAVFVAGTSPTMFGARTFSELAAAQNVAARFEATAYEKWKSFRESEDSLHVGLVMPRMRLRLPYRRDPAAQSLAFQHDEAAEKAASRHGLWGNPAYALAVSLMNAFCRPPWCTAPRASQDGSRMATDLPTAAAPVGDGPSTVQCSTDMAITDHWRGALVEQGFIPLCGQRDDGTPLFIDIPSCRLPRRFRSDDQTLAARLSTQLSCALAVSRATHYLQTILRYRAASFRSAQDLHRYLTGWMSRYVTASDSTDTKTQALLPFSEARIEVADSPGDPGDFRVTTHLTFSAEHFGVVL